MPKPEEGSCSTARLEAPWVPPSHEQKRSKCQGMAALKQIPELSAPSLASPQGSPTHIFQSDDVGVLPIAQKNLNLF